MPISNQEALAGVKLLAAIAKADGTLAPEERAVLVEALDAIPSTAGTAVDAIVDAPHDVDALIAQITTQDARDATFSSCFAMAYADRQYHPAEQAILEKLEKAWTVPPQKKGLLGRIYQEARDTVSLSAIQPIADPARRAAQIREDVLKYSVLSAVLGLNPIPIVSIATEVAVVSVQAKMFRDIGQYYGRETTKDMVKQVFGAVGVGTGGRIAVNSLVKAFPGLGSAFAATTNFASTWALGKVATQFWESGGKADMKMLQDLFKRSKAEGKKEYEAHKAEVEAKSKAEHTTLEHLAADYKAGKITQAEYEKSVAELK